MQKTHTKNLDLTNYGLSCGYINRHEYDKNVLQFYKEHNCFHVKYTNYNDTNKSYWNTFDRLTEARKAYKTELRKMRSTRAYF